MGGRCFNKAPVRFRNSAVKTSFHRVGILLTFAVSLSVTPAECQNTSAQIEGLVRDAGGKPVSGASVILQQADGPQSREAKTTELGAFSFSNLSFGTYRLQVSKSGFRGASEDSLQLSAAEKKHCEFVLQIASASSGNLAGGFQLDDKPNFVVAGVSDSSGSGGHAAETRLRTGEALAKETVKLKGESIEAAVSSGGSSDLVQARERIGRRLASPNGLSKTQEADLHRSLGDIDEDLNDPLAAEKEYERAVNLDPGEPNYFAWGSELLLHRAAAPAVEVFEKGARLYPYSARMLAGLGAALFTSSSADEAAQRLCQAADLEPANPVPYLFLGKMQEGTSSALPCVEQKLERFAENQPQNALANYYYGLALWKANRGSENPKSLQRAAELFGEAATIDSKLDAAILQLGNLQFARGLIQEAIAAYRKAIAIDPENSEAHYRLGSAYKRAGEASKAQTEFELYKQLDKTEAEKTERERRELRQFLFVLKGEPSSVQ